MNRRRSLDQLYDGINHFPPFNQIEPCQQEDNCPELRKTREELRKTLNMYDARGKQLERYSEMHAQLCRERDEARTLARQAYGLLRDWGYICVTCGAMLSRADFEADIWNCPKCSEREEQ